MSGVRLIPDLPVEARRWRNNPEIMQWCRQNHLISADEQDAWYARIKLDPSIKMFGIETLNTDIFEDRVNYEYGNAQGIGVCGLTSVSMVHRHAEFSLYIAPGYKGNGYGKEALIALLHYGFYNLGLHRIWGEVFIGNPAMQMFQDVGFFKEGICRQSYFKNGKFIDSEIISILRGEYDNRYAHSDPAPSVPLSLSMLTTKEESTNSEGDQRPQGIDL